MRLVSFLALTFVFFFACSDSTTAPSSSPSGEDAGTDTGGGGGGTDSGDALEDAGADADEGPLPQQTEMEPNDGTPATAVNAMTIPGIMSGTIDPAKDVDIFSIDPAAGEFWEWTLAPTGSSLAPHLTVFDSAPSNQNPNHVAIGTAGQTIELQQFVLNAGKFLAVVRDARNVGADAGVGGAGFGYSLTARKKTVTPTTLAVPSTKGATLPSLSSVDLYTFTLSASTGLDVYVHAAEKTAPSTLDSRLSLFSTTTKKDIGTNDDATASTTDSQLGGTLPAGTYVVIVENEGTDASDLSYEVEIKLR
jgi:hypothetical protein